VEFSDGTVIVADAQHQWRTTTRASRRAAHSGRAFHWPDEAVRRVEEAYRSACAEPDKPITHREAIAVVGEEFRHVLHTAQKEIRTLGKVPALVGGPVRSDYVRRLPAYPAAELFGALYARVTTPKNAALTVQHKSVVTTEEIAASLRCASDGRPNHAVAVAAAFDLEPQDVPLPPYALGVWLGDGESAAARFTTTDPEIIANLEAEGLRITRAGSTITYRMSLPEPESVGVRACVVCGTAFMPRTSEVRTCAVPVGAGRDSCQRPWPHRRVLIVVGLRAACDVVRSVTGVMAPFRASCARWGSLVTSTFRRRTCAGRSSRGVTCWPGCSTPTDMSARAGRSSSL
jgi:replicative DNA helicase